MSLDTVVLQAMADECAPMAGSKIVAIEQYGPNEIGLVLRGDAGRHGLVLCVQPGSARIYRSDPGRKSEGSSAFLSSIREYLLAGRFDRIEAIPDDRIMVIHATGRTPSGIQQYQIIAELIDRHNMLVLTSVPDQTIIETLRRVRTGDRDPSSGETYEFPPRPSKLSFPEMTMDQLAEASIEDGPIGMARSLNRKVSSLSPAVAREIVAVAGLSDERIYVGTHETERLKLLWRGLSDTMALITERVWTPSLGLDENGTPIILSALHISSSLAPQTVRCESMSDAIERFYLARAAAELAKKRETDVRRALSEELKRLEKLVANLWKDAAVSDQEEEFRQYGELLTANLSSVKFGQSEAEVQNYYDSEQGSIIIALNPAISPADNAEKYFKRARKARDGKQIIEERLLLSEERLEQIRGLSTQLSDAPDDEAMEKIFYACIRLGLLKADNRKSSKHASRKKKRGDIHPRRFVTKDGSLVLVGRNNRENEVLTKTASPDDIWLHARDMGGSHVILKRAGKKEMPSKWTCHEAACVAAYFSKGRGSTTVPVDYTERRYVRKMKDAGPGKVIFTHEKTLFVAPELVLEEEDSGSPIEP
ncbi:MAG: fibronectin-binding domain-containing protein [Candidatus Latescibacteria bacterium]|nr:fibronectin-binding domain-containing protein [Candidatus Latescibacterota bacterium]